MNNTSQTIQEAKRLLKEDSSLKYYEAMRQAKEMHKKRAFLAGTRKTQGTKNIYN